MLNSNIPAIGAPNMSVIQVEVFLREGCPIPAAVTLDLGHERWKVRVNRLMGARHWLEVVAGAGEESSSCDCIIQGILNPVPVVTAKNPRQAVPELDPAPTMSPNPAEAPFSPPKPNHPESEPILIYLSTPPDQVTSHEPNFLPGKTTSPEPNMQQPHMSSQPPARPNSNSQQPLSSPDSSSSVPTHYSAPSSPTIHQQIPPAALDTHDGASSELTVPPQSHGDVPGAATSTSTPLPPFTDGRGALNPPTAVTQAHYQRRRGRQGARISQVSTPAEPATLDGAPAQDGSHVQPAVTLPDAGEGLRPGPEPFLPGRDNVKVETVAATTGFRRCGAARQHGRVGVRTRSMSVGAGLSEQ